jgi:hypothetical protein
MRVGSRFRIWPLCAAVAVAGCGAPGELFTPHPPLAAEAGITRLPTDRLGALLADMSKQVGFNRQGGELVTDTWINYSLFIQAETSGAGLDDSATAVAALWPQVLRLRLAHWRDTLAAHRPPVPDSLADSADAAGRERLLQQILIAAPSNAPDPQRAEAKNKATRLLARLDAGANFGELAARYSDDSVSRAAQGVMNPAPRGSFAARFDSAAWSLAPGQHSGLIETRAGYHIIRRPPLAEVRAKWLVYLTERRRPHLDSLYLADLSTRYKLEIPAGAAQRTRTALSDREHALKSNRPLAVYRGGAFTESELVTWIQGVGPLVVTRFDRMRDFELLRFVQAVAQTELVLRDVDSAGVGVTPAEWTSLRQQYHDDLDSLQLALRIRGSADADSARNPAWIEGKVNAMLDRLASGEKSRPPAGGLITVLRGRYPYRQFPDGVALALTEAAIVAKQRDTTTTKKPGGPGLRPAPGPPPIPGRDSAGAGPTQRRLT